MNGLWKCFIFIIVYQSLASTNTFNIASSKQYNLTNSNESDLNSIRIIITNTESNVLKKLQIFGNERLVDRDDINIVGNSVINIEIKQANVDRIASRTFRSDQVDNVIISDSTIKTIEIDAFFQSPWRRIVPKGSLTITNSKVKRFGSQNLSHFFSYVNITSSNLGIIDLGALDIYGGRVYIADSTIQNIRPNSIATEELILMRNSIDKIYINSLPICQNVIFNNNAFKYINVGQTVTTSYCSNKYTNATLFNNTMLCDCQTMHRLNNSVVSVSRDNNTVLGSEQNNTDRSKKKEDLGTKLLKNIRCSDKFKKSESKLLIEFIKSVSEQGICTNSSTAATFRGSKQQDQTYIYILVSCLCGLLLLFVLIYVIIVFRRKRQDGFRWRGLEPTEMMMQDVFTSSDNRSEITETNFHETSDQVTENSLGEANSNSQSNLLTDDMS